MTIVLDIKYIGLYNKLFNYSTFIIARFDALWEERFSKFFISFHTKNCTFF